MNTVQYLSKTEYEKLKQNIDFSDTELAIIDLLRKGIYTDYAIANKLNLSDYQYKKLKSLAQLKIYQYASN